MFTSSRGDKIRLRVSDYLMTTPVICVPKTTIASRPEVTLASAAYILNPSVVFDGAIWGQADSSWPSFSSFVWKRS